MFSVHCLFHSIEELILDSVLVEHQVSGLNRLGCTINSVGLQTQKNETCLTSCSSVVRVLGVPT